MRALSLNFAVGRRRLHRAGSVLLAISLLLAACVIWKCIDLAQQREQLRAARESWLEIQHKSKSIGGRRDVQSPALQGELKFANRVIGRLSMPWDHLFNELEASVDEQVVLIGVEPDAEKGRLVLTAEGRNLSAMLNYEKRLADSSLFRDVIIQNHQIQLQDPQKPVRFVIGAVWLPGAAGATLSSVGETEGAIASK